MSAPATHTQPSRKGKKAWRKNVDLTEVQSGLESTRTELLAGGIIAEKDSADLFTTDTAGDAEVARKQASQKLLKADEILAQRSAIPAIPKRKRKEDSLKDFEGSGPNGKKRKNGDYVSYKDLRRLKMIADGQAVGLQMEGEKAEHDPWGEAPVVKEEKFSFLEPVKPKVAPKSLALAPVPITRDGKAVKSVRKPEAGKSYNPNVVDWTALYEREGAAAVEKEKERLRLEAEVEAREQAALEEARRVEEAEKEAFATDYESAWESEWEGIQSGAEDSAVVHTKKVQKRKTPAERNKIKARKERERREIWEKKQKVRAEEEKRIKKIARELSEKDKARRPGTVVRAEGASDSSSDDEGIEKEIVRRRFGKVAMPEAPLEVTLPEDLEDSLRRLKPEGNLLTDRYRNLLLNGKVEIRKPVGQRKQKQTYRTEKWSYKDWELK